MPTWIGGNLSVHDSFNCPRISVLNGTKLGYCMSMTIILQGCTSDIMTQYGEFINNKYKWTANSEVSYIYRSSYLDLISGQTNVVTKI
jgi:hypothetical protein